LEAGDGLSQYSSSNEGWRRTVCTEKKLLRKILLIENELLGIDFWVVSKVLKGSVWIFSQPQKKKVFGGSLRQGGDRLKG
jgi:hypothetical protein